MVKQKNVESKALTIVEQAAAVVVTDSKSYIAAGEVWKIAREMMVQIAETFDPIIQKAHVSHKEALAQKAKFYKPLETAVKDVKRVMADYDAEQERRRRKEEKRLAEIARKEEEERQLREAAETLACGDVEEAEEILETEIIVPPPRSKIPKSTPKISGGPVHREIWKIRIINAEKIPRAYMLPDEKKLKEIARVMKDQFDIPGVKAYSEKV